MGIDITLKYIRILCNEEKYFLNPKLLFQERDVNVPHGKAATETLMLTTVVSLASDDPGPELL